MSTQDVHEAAIDIEALERRAEALVEAHRVLLRDLVKMRRKHNLTQSEVAERMSVSQPTVAAFERYDANPTLATVRRYALAVGACLDERVTDGCAHHEDLSSRRIEAIVTGAPPAKFKNAERRREVGVEWTPPVNAPQTSFVHA